MHCVALTYDITSNDDFPELPRKEPLNISHELIEQEPVLSSSSLYRDVYRSTHLLTHNLSTINDLRDVNQAVTAMFREMVEPIIKEYEDGDYVSIQANHAELDKSIYITYRTKKAMCYEDFIEAIASVSQSNKTFLMDGKLELVVRVVRRMKGSGHPRNVAVKTVEKIFLNKSSIITIRNDNNYCGYLSLALGVWEIVFPKKNLTKPQLRERKREFDLMQKDSRKRLTKYADKLFGNKIGGDINIQLNDEILGNIQKFYKDDFQIIVVKRPTEGYEMNIFQNMFSGESKSKNQIVIEFVEKPGSANHFNYVTSLAAYLGFSYWCSSCNKGYTNKNDHFCTAVCKTCRQQSDCKITENCFMCKECGTKCFGEQCFKNHLSTVHNEYRRCPNCEVRYNTTDKNITHECGKIHCYKFNEKHQDNPHYCFMKPLKLETLIAEDDKLKILVAFDIETASVPVANKNKSFLQEPIMLIANVICDFCWNTTKEEKTQGNCSTCGNFEHIFTGNNCVKQFNDLVLGELSNSAGKKKGKVHVYAHNLAGFDGRFVLRDIIDRKISDVSLVMTGNRMLKIGLCNVRYSDSLAYFQQPLSSLPKSFNFEEKSKGFFPHKFTTEVNWNYVGDLPGHHFYEPQFMKPEQSRIFFGWHRRESERLKLSNTPWIFKDEITKYCRSDVNILLTALQKFRKEFNSITGLDTTTRNFTLASVGMETYRCLDLKRKQIGITPVSPYGSKRKDSVSCIAWLDALEKRDGVRIAREKHLGLYFADGYCEATNTVYEYQGCYWHMCDCTFKDPDEEVHLNGKSSPPKTPASKRKLDQEKQAYFKRMGFSFIEIKDCQFEIEFIKNRQNDWGVIDRMTELFASRRNPKYANIRESFFGGRTNNIQFLKECAGDEEIRYLDFTSLYPCVLKYMRYPIGHPKVITNNFNYKVTENNWYFGFVRCAILPPGNIYLPVLPVRLDKKLVFPLCRTCSEIGYQDYGLENATGIQDQFCHHNDCE